MLFFIGSTDCARCRQRGASQVGGARSQESRRPRRRLAWYALLVWLIFTPRFYMAMCIIVSLKRDLTVFLQLNLHCFIFEIRALMQVSVAVAAVAEEAEGVVAGGAEATVAVAVAAVAGKQAWSHSRPVDPSSTFRLNNIQGLPIPRQAFISIT